MSTESIAQAAMALDCACGHAESWHQWQSRRWSGLVHIGGCAWHWRKPPGDGPNVEHNSCPCQQYEPAQS